MAEIKVDLINYCNVNMSSPNSCNSSNLNQTNKVQNLANNLKSSPSPTSQLTDRLNGSTKPAAKFYVNNESIKDEPNTDEQQTDEQNEIIDQFNDFDHFDRRGSINEVPSTLATNYKFLENNFITNEDIGQVLKAFQEKAFKSGEYRAKDEKIQYMCLNLFNYDYKPDELIIINNNESDLSSSYPPKIIVPRTKAFPIDTERLRNLFMKAKYARCRCRFPVPVILYNNKYVCRSATLSHCIEIYSRQSYASFFRTGEDEQIQDLATEINEMNLDSLEVSPNFDIIDGKSHIANDKIANSNPRNDNNKSNGYFSAFKQDYSHTVNEARAQDILLLNYLNVKHIIDLMVEMKKVKYGIYVASSEKADKLKRYRDFNINVLPYPGCEFFKFYRDNNYQAEGLVYDWGQAFVDADLNIFENDLLNGLNIDFKNYKKWDLNDLTLNYLKLILRYLAEPSNESILLHCISGWDRTSGTYRLIE